MTSTIEKLMEAEAKALQLFQEIENRKLVVAEKSEQQLNTEVYDLAFELFGIEKYWHKRIVRAGTNTLRPYDDNPPDLIIQKDDILFLDFGPVFEDWEADFGRTYVIGNNPYKLKLKKDIETAWYETKEWFSKQTKLTGAEFYEHIMTVTKKYGYSYGGQLAGHLIGHFPHERLEPKNFGLYVHPENPNDMFLPDANGNQRHWILEIHFVNPEKQIGGFFEQVLC
ncbi:MAG: aminopeptidase P family protein [Chitinophagales bacterium]|nr:aminopeptidase P family protein [Chitinophagales bacterium]